jgi:hypothetical protein
VAHFGRLQRIPPRNPENDNPSTDLLDFYWEVIVDLLRCMAKGLFVYNYEVRDKIIAFRHGF